MSHRSMSQRSWWFSACLTAAILIAATAIIPNAQAKDPKRTITMSATGTINVKPDTAHISTGVVSDAETARTALDQNSTAMKRVISELKKQGLKKEDIQTTNFSVSPRYQRFKDNRPPRLIGYRVNNSVRIRVKDLTDLGAILDTVVTLGSNQIGGISFSVSKADEFRDKARTTAMQRAMAKAEIYTEAAGIELGEIISIRESSSFPRPRRGFARAAMKSSAESVPIEAGEQSLRVRVDVSWELN